MYRDERTCSEACTEVLTEFAFRHAQREMICIEVCTESPTRRAQKSKSKGSALYTELVSKRVKSLLQNCRDQRRNRCRKSVDSEVVPQRGQALMLSPRSVELVLQMIQAIEACIRENGDSSGS